MACCGGRCFGKRGHTYQHVKCGVATSEYSDTSFPFKLLPLTSSFTHPTSPTIPHPPLPHPHLLIPLPHSLLPAPPSLIHLSPFPAPPSLNYLFPLPAPPYSLIPPPYPSLFTHFPSPILYSLSLIPLPLPPQLTCSIKNRLWSKSIPLSLKRLAISLKGFRWSF